MIKPLSKEKQIYFMSMAITAAKGSKDGSSKVGAILVRPDKSIASTGYNGFPKRIFDNHQYINSPHFRKEKLLRTVHAECNCLNYCRDNDLWGYSLFVNHNPCSACALRICSTEITSVYYIDGSEQFLEKWHSDITDAKILFHEARINLVDLTPSFPKNDYKSIVYNNNN